MFYLWLFASLSLTLAGTDCCSLAWGRCWHWHGICCSELEGGGWLVGEEGVGWEERGYGRAEDALNGLGGGGWIRGSDPLDSSPRSSFIFRAGWRWKRQKRKMSVICSRKTSERLRGPPISWYDEADETPHHDGLEGLDGMAWHTLPTLEFWES